MKKQKGNLMQKIMAVLLSAVLVVGMAYGGVPISVRAQEGSEPPESVSGNDAGTAPGAEYQSVMMAAEPAADTIMNFTLNIYGYNEAYNNGDFKLKYGSFYEPEEMGIAAKDGYTEVKLRFGLYLGFDGGIMISLYSGEKKLVQAGATAKKEINYSPEDIYAVNFMNDGDVVAVDYVCSGEQVAEPAAPEKKGYTFAGWVTADGGSEKFDFSQRITDVTTLYASWTAMPSHSHKVCAGSACTDDSHGDVEWKALTLVEGRLYAGDTEIGLTRSGYVLPDGNYYLEENLALGSAQIDIENVDVNLCLNGKTLDMGSHGVWLYGNSGLTLCDCVGSGEITSAETAVGVASIGGTARGIFTMYGGSLKGGSCDLSLGDRKGTKAELIGGKCSSIKVKLRKTYGAGGQAESLDTPVLIGQPVAAGTEMTVDWNWDEEYDGPLPSVPVIKAAKGYDITESDLENLGIKVAARGYTDKTFEKRMENGQIYLKLRTSTTGGGKVDKDVLKDDSAPSTEISTPVKELTDMVLTPEEKQRLEEGIDVRIVLDVKDARDSVSSEDKALVEAALYDAASEGFALGQYLDISLFKMIGENRIPITLTTGKITITLTIPDSLKSPQSSSARSFAVARVHDGVAEVLSDLDSDDNTITIETDRFSTYAIIYRDTANGGNTGGEDTPGGDGNTGGGDTPGGDGNTGGGDTPGSGDTPGGDGNTGGGDTPGGDGNTGGGDTPGDDGNTGGGDTPGGGNTGGGDTPGGNGNTGGGDTLGGDSSIGGNTGGANTPGGNGNTGSGNTDTKQDSAKDNEPKTGEAFGIEVYATPAMIAGAAYLLLYFADSRRGMTEETKKELVARLVGWARRGGRGRKLLAIAAIFVLLVYYHSIGRKTCVEWKEMYGE